MPKFRKLPVVINAVLWDGTNDRGVAEFLRETESGVEISRRSISYQTSIISGLVVWNKDPIDDSLTIPTQKGATEHKVMPGHWIIRGATDEYYGCPPEVFAKTYEPADD